MSRTPAAVAAEWVPVIQDALVRRSVGALRHGRTACRHCHRTPLVGECVHFYADDRPVCELCTPLHRGLPQRSELVRATRRPLRVHPA
jgi:hypothetical protein